MLKCSFSFNQLFLNTRHVANYKASFSPLSLSLINHFLLPMYHHHYFSQYFLLRQELAESVFMFVRRRRRRRVGSKGVEEEGSRAVLVVGRLQETSGLHLEIKTGIPSYHVLRATVL